MTVEFGVHAPPAPAEPSGFTVVGRVMQGSVRVGDVFIEAEGPSSPGRWVSAASREGDMSPGLRVAMTRLALDGAEAAARRWSHRLGAARLDRARGSCAPA